MFSLSQFDYREALQRHKEIQRDADRLGPIMYELSLRKKPSLVGRVSGLVSVQVSRLQGSLAALVRVSEQPDCQSVC